MRIVLGTYEGAVACVQVELPKGDNDSKAPLPAPLVSEVLFAEKLHKGSVKSLSVSEDQSRLATCGSDEVVLIYDLDNLRIQDQRFCNGERGAAGMAFVRLQKNKRQHLQVVAANGTVTFYDSWNFEPLPTPCSFAILSKNGQPSKKASDVSEVAVNPRIPSLSLVRYMSGAIYLWSAAVKRPLKVIQTAPSRSETTARAGKQFRHLLWVEDGERAVIVGRHCLRLIHLGREHDLEVDAGGADKLVFWTAGAMLDNRHLLLGTSTGHLEVYNIDTLFEQQAAFLKQKPEAATAPEKKRPRTAREPTAADEEVAKQSAGAPAQEPVATLVCAYKCRDSKATPKGPLRRVKFAQVVKDKSGAKILVTVSGGEMIFRETLYDQEKNVVKGFRVIGSLPMTKGILGAAADSVITAFTLLP